ncbi:hypothetical protein BDV18DRAFT_37720 [Aspergillus unguis]
MFVYYCQIAISYQRDPIYQYFAHSFAMSLHQVGLLIIFQISRLCSSYVQYMASIVACLLQI